MTADPFASPPGPHTFAPLRGRPGDPAAVLAGRFAVAWVAADVPAPPDPLLAAAVRALAVAGPADVADLDRVLHLGPDRSAAVLAEACRLGAYRPAHRLSESQRHVRAELAVRDVMVRTRTRYVALIKALVRRDGLRLGAGSPERTAARLALLDATGVVSDALRAEVAPLLRLLEPLNAEIAAADRRLTALTASDPRVRRLTTAPGVGPVTATAFVATLDDVGRFRDAPQVMAYLGLA